MASILSPLLAREAGANGTLAQLQDIASLVVRYPMTDFAIGTNQIISILIPSLLA